MSEKVQVVVNLSEPREGNPEARAKTILQEYAAGLLGSDGSAKFPFDGWVTTLPTADFKDLFVDFAVPFGELAPLAPTEQDVQELQDLLEYHEREVDRIRKLLERIEGQSGT